MLQSEKTKKQKKTGPGEAEAPTSKLDQVPDTKDALAALNKAEETLEQTLERLCGCF